MEKPLHEQKCVPCEGGVPPMMRDEAMKIAAEVNGWDLADNAKSISKEFEFKDFKEAITFINKVADVAEEQAHHPDIYCFYNKVKLELSTHAIKGLSNNDFIMASKINRLA
jgi:4a-hydroxytetrahydrobiopterin dehydratase